MIPDPVAHQRMNRHGPVFRLSLITSCRKDARRERQYVFPITELTGRLNNYHCFRRDWQYEYHKTRHHPLQNKRSGWTPRDPNRHLNHVPGTWKKWLLPPRSRPVFCRKQNERVKNKTGFLRTVSSVSRFILSNAYAGLLLQ